jgi:hypothetical protein
MIKDNEKMQLEIAGSVAHLAGLWRILRVCGASCGFVAQSNSIWVFY